VWKRENALLFSVVCARERGVLIKKKKSTLDKFAAPAGSIFFFFDMSTQEREGRFELVTSAS
jgi:predicted oxidoreductase (fatty acid repression mutant protein)